MATTIIKSIGSGGGRDYATIAAWVAAIPANLVTADQQWIGELYNDSEFDLAGTTVTINKITDATRNIILRCAAGHSFKDHANKLTNELRYNQSNGVGIVNNGVALLSIQCDYVQVEGIQFRDTASGGARVTQGTTNAPNVVVRNCIFQTANSNTGTGGLSLYNGTAVNCLAVGTGGGTAFISNGGSAKFINCLAFQFGAGSGFGFRGNYDSPLYRNCAAFGFNTNFRSGTSASSNYNASSQASPPGANSLSSLTASSQFENVTSSAAFDGRIKAGSSLISAGVREQTYTNDLDIVGSARSTTTPTIGPWEHSAGGGGGNATGVILTATASLIAGSASGSGSASANGVTLTATSSLIAGSASGVINGVLTFQAAGLEFGGRTGLGIDTFAIDNGVSYRYSVHADGLTLGAAILTSSAIALDSAGKLPNLVSNLLTPGTTYRVFAIRQTDGEAATFRLTAS